MRKGYKIPKADLFYEEEIDEAGFGDYVPPSKIIISIYNNNINLKKEVLIRTSFSI